MSEREEFLDYIRTMVDYWDYMVHPDTPQRERLSGLAFSILSGLDGAAGDLPAYAVVPLSEESKNADGVEGDLGGALHEHLYHRGRWRYA